LTELKLFDAGSHHSVSSVTIYKKLDYKRYPSNGFITPPRVHVFSVVSNLLTEVKGSAEAILVALTHVQGGIETHERSSEELIPAPRVVRHDGIYHRLYDWRVSNNFHIII